MEAIPEAFFGEAVYESRAGTRAVLLTVVPHFSVVFAGAQRLHRRGARRLRDTARDGGAGGDECASARA